MLNRNLIARAVAGVVATGSVFAVPSAHAALTFNHQITRILPCSIATNVGEPACTSALTPDTAKYQIDFAVSVTNPAPATPPATTPPATPVNLSTASLDSVFGAGKWVLVSNTLSGLTAATPAAYDGKTALTLGSTTNLEQGKTAGATVRVEVLVTDGAIPSITANLGGAETASRVAKIYVPAKRSTDPAVGNTCQLVANAAELVRNGDFKKLSTDLNFPVNSSEANPIPGADFFSEVPLTNQGFGVYDENKTISIVRGTSVSSFAQQLPLPGGSVNWLRHGGGAKNATGTPINDNPQKFWNQRVTGLTAGKDYQIQAWFSNISDPDSNQSAPPPKIRFMVDGEDMNGADLTLTPETSATGDTWYLLSGTFQAKASNALISIINKQVGWEYNQAAVTEISLKECVPGTISNSAATATGGGSSQTPSGGTGTSTSTSGGGGGGGAFGLGGLALLGLGALMRRRIGR